MSRNVFSVFFLLYSLNIYSTTYTVVTTLDVGSEDEDSMDLRGAITSANSNPGRDTIVFDIGAGATINIDSSLPNLSDNDGVVINGWENGANDGTPNSAAIFSGTLNAVYQITINNNNNVATGFVLSSNNNVIKGLVLQNFGDGTVSVNDIAITVSGNNNAVEGCYIGVAADGTTPGTKTNIGIAITSGSGNTIGTGGVAGVNLISGMINGTSQSCGIYITAPSSGNIIKGNSIGVQKNGSAIPTGSSQINGIYTIGSNGNTIGGTTSGEGNLLSGNSTYGIHFSSSNSNTVYGNRIGTQKDGSTILTSGTQSTGVYINGSNSCIIGGSSSSHRNIISGNTLTGVSFLGSATGTQLKGNYIGIASDGVSYITSNSQDYGIDLSTTTFSVTIGGTNAGEGNVISGNGNSGITGYGIQVRGGNHNIYGNIIGPKETGATALSATHNQNYGIYITSSNSNTVGGTGTYHKNIISDNRSTGISISGASTGNLVKGNYIGIATDGITHITSHTQATGVDLSGGATNYNQIGGTVAGEGNVISGNTSYGVYSPSANNNYIYGNFIGTQKDGSTLVTNSTQNYGIWIGSPPFTASANNIIGHSSGIKQVISGNRESGVFIYYSGSTGNIIRGNYIGLASNGTSEVTGSSQDVGVELSSTVLNTIGGTVAGQGNVISGNDNGASAGIGIQFSGTGTSGNYVYGNIIGPRADGSTFLNTVQSKGIDISSSPNIIIGGSNSNFRNIISANGTYGIYIAGATSTGTQIKGNYIGIASNGTSYIASNSQDYGIYTYTNCPSVTIGGTNTGEGNVISGNGNSTITNSYGIYLDNAGNAVYGNIIGARASGTTAVSAAHNQNHGVYINNKANNVIGGSSTGYRNYISDNRGYGISINGASASGTIIKGNYIGIATDGNTFITSNTQSYGIHSTSASYIQIGGTNAGEGNVISGAPAGGIGIYFSPGFGTATNNSILGNIIGPRKDGSTYVGSQATGIYLSSSGNNTIGGTENGKNIISANLQYGIFITGGGSSGNVIKGNYIGLASNGDTYIASSTQDYGVYILIGGSNTIGGTATGEGNLISGQSDVLGGSTGSAIYINSSSSNSVYGNIIGPQKDGTTNVTNNDQSFGIYLSGSANNTIGGSSSAFRNIISANLNTGVYITGASSTGNQVKGNYIGIASNGSSLISSSSQDIGVYIDGLGANTIGGTNAGEGNVISGNDDGSSLGIGIYTLGKATIIGNTIGPAADGLTDLAAGQNTGIDISNGVDNTIGGSSSGHRNIISQNINAGIYGAPPGTGNIIKGNYIGLQSNGTTLFSPTGQAYGVYLTGGNAGGVTIGGTNSNEGNVISGNTLGGIYNDCIAGGTYIYGNIIGPQKDGSTYVTSNTQTDGIVITNSRYNIIGGSSQAYRNIISANESRGVWITGAGSRDNIIKGNYIGIASNGQDFITNSTQNNGIAITGGALINTIGGTVTGEGNLISGNFTNGLQLSAGSANLVYGNIIGPQKDALTAVASNTQEVGILLTGNTQSNIIGTGTAAGRNIINGNFDASGVTTDVGIYMQGATTTGNTIKGNYIGLGSDGATRITGQQYGIWTNTNTGGPNTIGGVTAAEGNVISGNGNSGVGIYLQSTGGFTIQNNIIGPEADGITDVTSNSQRFGIYVDNSPNHIIGTNSSTGNTIAGNMSVGISIIGPSSSGVSIKGNKIGVGNDGTTVVTSQPTGISVSTTAPSVTIGGSLANEGNTIAGNTTNGISITNTAGGNIVYGNYLGTYAGATSSLSASQDNGIYINNSPNNIIGGSTTAMRNIISDNVSPGIHITGASATGTIIKGNYIGIADDGATYLSGSGQTAGVFIHYTATGTTIGGSAAGEGNVISGNSNTGVYIGDITNASNGQNVIIGNIIGPQANGNSYVTSNAQLWGIQAYNISNNVIGAALGLKQVISGNEMAGIVLSLAGSTGNVIRGNYIGIASNGTSIISGASQEWGLAISTAASSNTIGGTVAGEGNVISGNEDGVSTTVSGIILSSAGSSNAVYGNIIGPAADGTSFLASSSQAFGINIFSTPNTIIGGSTAAFRNIISGNNNYGVYIYGSGSTGNAIKGNYIGSGSGLSGLTGADDQDYGVYIGNGGSTSASKNTIGGTTGAGSSNPEGNVIAFNTADGIYITTAASSGNLISKNLIYSNGSANKAINLNGSGNSNFASPVINTNYTATSVNGTSTANAIIEVFKKVATFNADNHCQQAQQFLGTATADGSGVWTFSPGGTILNAGDTPLATARSSTNNNTSEFNCPNTAIGLPIELLYFNAEKINETSVKTHWQTATEINNDYFTIQRSTDALEFEDIGVVDGAGNSSSVISYQLLDNNFPTLNFSTLYYRLKQTDFDGSFSYSNIVAVDLFKNNSSLSNFNIYPNPTTGDNINITLTGEANSEIKIIIRDVLGKELYAKTFITDNTITSIQLSDGFSLASGVYTITASNKNTFVSKKVVIK